MGDLGRVDIDELENGRGLQTLWGLDGPRIEKTTISRDGRLIAALAQDFRVGIWQEHRSAGRLLHVLEVPIGVFTDNAGLAFSPDGRCFAFAAGTQVRIWDVTTGEILKTWTLPEGFQDNLAFLGPDRLISTRVETSDPRLPPYGTDPEKYPRVVRIRDLDVAAVPRLHAEIFDLNLHVFYSELTLDGRSLLIEGRRLGRSAVPRLVKAFDIAGNHELWTFRDTHPEVDAALFHFDPTGRLFMRSEYEGPVRLLEFPSCAVLETYAWCDERGCLDHLSPGGRLRLSLNASRVNPPRICLWGPRQELLMALDNARPISA